MFISGLLLNTVSISSVFEESFIQEIPKLKHGDSNFKFDYICMLEEKLRQLLLCLFLRLVLMGNESQLKSVAKMIRESLDGNVVVEVVGLNMEEEREAAFDEAVDKAWKILGYLDALVHCYTYEGNSVLPLSL